METLILIGLGFLGILLYNLAKAKQYIADNTFSPTIFFTDNYKKWAWSAAVLIVVAILIQLEPKANDLIKVFTGLDLENTRAGWALFGAGVCGLVRNAKTNK